MPAASAPETAICGSQAAAHERFPFPSVPKADDEEATAAACELQYQRNQLAAACAPALARGVPARRGRPSGAQVHRRGVPARKRRGARLFGDLAWAASVE